MTGMPPLQTLQQLQDAIGDRYALERELGRGGMGTVWLARDLRLDRPVAIKVLNEELAASREARDRFIREARTAARLAHPHIVPVFGVENRGDLTFLTMAMIDGETLGSLVRRRGPLPSDLIERMVREVAWALGYAHSQGVVHRDITPENILIERGTGRALVADFGLAHHSDVHESSAVGTPGYIAPELIRGDVAQPASDLYALGATGWFALTGTPPYSGDTTGEVLAKHLIKPLPELPLAARAASRRLVELLKSCLAKDAEARPADAATLLSGIERTGSQVALATPLIDWFTRWQRVRAGYAMAAPVVAVQLLMLMQAALGYGGRFQVLVAMWWVVSILMIPVAIHLMSEFTALRRLARQGFGIGDIRSAWNQWTDVLRIEYRREGLPPLARRVIFDLTIVGAFTLVVGSVSVASLPLLLAGSEVGSSAIALMELLSWVFLGTGAGAAVNLLSPGVRPNPDGLLRRLAHRFWRSRIAGLLARSAAGGVSATGAASKTLHRNTELVLGLAIDTLWKAIPDIERQPFGDVPAVAATLQHGAEELRSVARELVDACAALPDGHPEIQRLEATADQVTTQHRDAIGQLESLRMQLLRAVSSRTVTTDLADEIAAAREAERRLLHGIAGANEARTALGKPGRRDPFAATPTPTPTPVVP